MKKQKTKIKQLTTKVLEQMLKGATGKVKNNIVAELMRRDVVVKF